MSYFFYLLSFLSGLVLTLQLGINSQLKDKIHNPFIVCLISIVGSLFTLIIIILYKYISGDKIIPSIMVFNTTEWWMYLGGLLGAFYIIATIASASRIGYTNMFSLVICAQILLSAFFDHYGIMSNTIISISPLKAIGVVLLIIATYIIQTN